jgi:G6PDH family F420-dependent oxidoreductase
MRGRRTRRPEIGLDIGENHKDPADFRDAVILAGRLGFDVAWLGDHFMPWVHSGARSAFVWSLLGSSFEASKKVRVGPYVTTPIGGRYHPAVVAQAAATLDSMYPGRFVLGVGTGEAMNEAPFMPAWPRWRERMDRLIEGVQFMRKLWTSDSYFDFDGKYFKSRQVFLYTKPRTDIKVLFSSVGEKSATIAGEHGDGIITVNMRNSLDRIRQTIFGNFDAGARAAGKDPSTLEKVVTVGFTFESEREFLKRARGGSGPLAKGSYDEPDPRRIERMGSTIPDDDLLRTTQFCSSWPEVAELVWRYKDMGATQVVLPAAADPELIRRYARRLLPLLAP